MCLECALPACNDERLLDSVLSTLQCAFTQLQRSRTDFSLVGLKENKFAPPLVSSDFDTTMRLLRIKLISLSAIKYTMTFYWGKKSQS